MPWQARHEGSPRLVRDLTLGQLVQGLRDGKWETTDEVVGPGETVWRSIESHPQLAEVVRDLEQPSPPRHLDPTSLDMNALIDVCLVLLIFFILTTSYANLVQKVVPIPSESPKAEGKAKSVKIGDVNARMIRLEAIAGKDGRPQIRVQNQQVDVVANDGKSIDTARLQAELQIFTRGEDRKTELLLDARGVSWETVIQIQDAARAARVQTIHYAK